MSNAHALAKLLPSVRERIAAAKTFGLNVARYEGELLQTLVSAVRHSKKAVAQQLGPLIDVIAAGPSAANNLSRVLTYAIDSANPDTVRILLADPRVTIEGHLPLRPFLASHRSADIAIIGKLVRHPSFTADAAADACCAAAKYGNYDAVALLLRHDGTLAAVRERNATVASAGQAAAALGHGVDVDNDPSPASWPVVVQRLRNEALFDPVELLKGATLRGGPPALCSWLASEARRRMQYATAAQLEATSDVAVLFEEADDEVSAASLPALMMCLSPALVHLQLQLADRSVADSTPRLPSAAAICAAAWTRRRAVVLARAHAMADLSE